MTNPISFLFFFFVFSIPFEFFSSDSLLLGLYIKILMHPLSFFQLKTGNGDAYCVYCKARCSKSTDAKKVGGSVKLAWVMLPRVSRSPMGSRRSCVKARRIPQIRHLGPQRTRPRHHHPTVMGIRGRD
jgi:hypothetical protein